MIKATTKFADRVASSYIDFGGELDKPVKIARNKKGQVLARGVYIGVNPKCDGDDLCGLHAEYIVTFIQQHEVSFSKEKAEITSVFRNYLLLCNNCMELYKKTDVMIGQPLALKEFSTDGSV